MTLGEGTGAKQDDDNIPTGRLRCSFAGLDRLCHIQHTHLYGWCAMCISGPGNKNAKKFEFGSSSKHGGCAVFAL